jgi:CheY-like chemotaxis protein
MTSKRVLVIEDNEDGREMLVSALRLIGHEVQSASTGREGIERRFTSPQMWCSLILVCPTCRATR